MRVVDYSKILINNVRQDKGENGIYGVIIIILKEFRKICQSRLFSILALSIKSHLLHAKIQTGCNIGMHY